MTKNSSFFKTMAKIEVCRICLASDTQMRFVVNKKIHKVFEKLTELPYITTDSRPNLVCYICCGFLYNCHQLRVNALRSEQFFQQVMNSAGAPPKLEQLPTARRYQKTPIVHMNCTGQITAKAQEKTPIKTQATEKPKTPVKKQNSVKTPVKKQVSEKTPIKTQDIVNTPVKKAIVVDKSEVKEEKIKESKPPEDEVIDLDDDFILNIIKKASERLEKPDEGEKNIPNDQEKEPEVENVDSEDNSDQMDDVPLKTVQEKKRCDEAMNKKKKRKRTKTTETEDVPNLDTENPTEQKSTGQKKKPKPDTNESKVKKNRKSPRKQVSNDIPYKDIETNQKETFKVSSTSFNCEILCNLCHNMFYDEQELTEHLILETETTLITVHKCDICSKCFRSKCILNRHARTHTEKHLQKCNICSRLFTDESLLREHLRTHTS